MDAVVKFLQPLDLHPVVDHFSVALLFVAVLIDLVASAAPTRIWLRYSAVMLMILGRDRGRRLVCYGRYGGRPHMERAGAAGARGAASARATRRVSRDHLRHSRGVANPDTELRLHGGVARDLFDRCDPGGRNAGLLRASRRRAGVRLRRGHGADGVGAGTGGSRESGGGAKFGRTDSDSVGAHSSGDLDRGDSVGDGVCDQRGQHRDPGANHCTVGFGDRGDDVTQLEARHKF